MSRLLFLLVALVLPASVSLAATPAIDGIVRDSGGRPVAGASVWIGSTNGSKFSKVVKSDANGRYVADHLTIGPYQVAVLVNGSLKTAMVNAIARASKPTEVNFSLSERVHPGKTHMVWIPADTGSHLGRWIEVDDNGHPVNTVGAAPMQRAAGNALMLGVGQPH